MALNMLKSDNSKIVIGDTIPKSVFANDEAKKEFNKIIEMEKKMWVKKNYSINQIKINTILKKIRTIRTVDEDIYNGEITLEEADKDQSDLVQKINDFTKTTRPRSDKKKQEKENVEKILYYFCEDRKK